jgi:hypothetical protein
MAGKRKSANESLAKLSRGLSRETPVTRTRPEVPEPEGDGGEVGAPGSSEGTAVAQERWEAPRRRGRPRTRTTERMVRVSVDLPRPDHKYLRDFAYDAESDGMSVMRALLEEMRDDENLAERVLDRLSRKHGRGE